MRLSFLALALALAPCVASRAAERAVVRLDSRLREGGGHTWLMRKASEVRDGGREVSTVGYSGEGWAEAAVPGTVLANLVRQGVCPDPYYGQNNKLSNALIPDLAKAGREAYTYWFRTELTVPASFRGKRVWLEPEGINYRAEVWVNGALRAVMAGMFNSRPIDVTDCVRPGERAALAIRVYPVDVPGTSKRKTWGAAGEWSNGGDGWIGQNVTQLMTVGWDFTFEDGVRDRNTGIWRSVLLYATGPVQLRHPMVRSRLRHPDYGQASLTVEADVCNPGTGGAECVVRGEIEGTDIRLEKRVKIPRGERRTVTFTPEDFPRLTLDKPRLWWPRNKGPQNLYTLRLTAVGAKGETWDSITTRFGIREVTATRETPDRSKLLVVNGHKVFVRGSNWIPEAMLRTDDARMASEMALTRQSGVNLLRLWGGGIAESDLFYELCDEYGIMVWQEFWMTGDTRHPADEALYLANVESTVRRIRNHPSLVIYVSSNESTAVTGAERLLERLDGTRPYQTQSECDGVHDGSPYKQVNPMRHYENTASDRGSRVDGFNPEYGAPTLPIAESLREMMPASALWPADKATWDYMDGNGFHLMSTLYTDMVNQYGPSRDIDEFARKGQMVGAVNSKSVWEVWNENKLGYGDRWCSGLLFWYHNCPQPQVCARMWDWWLEPTASLYHTMHALEPVHAQFNFMKNTVSLVNDYLEPLRGVRVRADVYNMDSRRVARFSARADIPADGVANDALRVDFPGDVSPVHFLAVEAADSTGRVLSRNVYWRSTDKYEGKTTLTGPCVSGFAPLAHMPQARPSARARRVADKEGMDTWEVELRNGGKRIAFFCQLLLTDGQGRAVHRTRYSDNFLTLLPGERQTVTIQTPKGGPARPELQLRENQGEARVVAMR